MRAVLMRSRAVCKMLVITSSPAVAPSCSQIQSIYLKRLKELLSQPTSLPTRETTVATIGALGRQSTEDLLCTMLELLLQQLGSSSSALRSLAMTEVSGRNKTPNDSNH